MDETGFASAGMVQPARATDFRRYQGGFAS